MTTSNRTLVVAIEFGTTYSGYAYSFVHDFKSNPLNVETMIVTTPNGQMVQVPTSVLFDPQQQFNSFGVEAEEKYARMREKNRKEAGRWYYFERFMMTLHKNPSLTQDTELLDQTQKKSMLAIDVFSAAISHLKKDFMNVLQKKWAHVPDNEITWVLTIPATWEDQARQFMREAAEKACIPREQLVLALEPEAASVYCLALCKANPNLVKPFTVRKGAKFMLVDSGRGTIDISILEITATGNLGHLHKPAGTDDGGVSVDKAFSAFLVDLGFDGFTSLEPLEILHLRRSLEKTKRYFKASDEKAHIQIPPSVKELLSVFIASSEKYSKRVSILRNVLSLDGDLFLSFYNQATAGITAAIRNALGTNTVDAIFLAGGFCECDVIQNAVQQTFPEVQVVTAQTVSQSLEGRQPFSPVGAVLMGAVMYGHDPQVIPTRVSAQTFGANARKSVEGGEHDVTKRKTKMDAKDRLLVVAIDIGTTYSGYAFSFVEDFKSKPLNVKTMHVTTPYGQMDKVPTSILFDPKQQFHSFGEEAEEVYARMSEKDREEARRWYYFERFKMTLYKNPFLTRDMKLMDQTQRKSMLAMGVFSAAIFQMKKYCTIELQRKKTGVRHNEITWVLTIPAIWEDQARQLMRDAAEKAGIPREQLVLALEPEAASVYCLAFCRANQSLMKPFTVGKGAKFMLVDCGGGTIDISILEITANGNLRHIHKPAGTADGGISVDDAFKAFLLDLVGFDGVTSLEPLEMLHLRRSLEKTKRSFKASDEKAHIQIPRTVQEVLSVVIASLEKYSKRVSIAKNVLSLEGDLYLSFYNQATAGITAAIRDALGTNTVDAIFLAGGFSESDVIQNAVQQAFPEVQVVTAQTVSQSVEGCQPFSPVGAVLMGAVMYGHDPQVIPTRVSAQTFGVNARKSIEGGEHDVTKRKTKMEAKDRMLVVAIDFGTTYSGYAFSFVEDFESKPLNVETMNVTTPYGQMDKVPTSILFDPKQQFHSFGAEAEEEFARMSEKDREEARMWYYFERFKMTLHKNPSLTRDMKLLDQTQKKSMLAMGVFSAAISHLKKNFTNELQTKTDVRDNEITWELTVPAIWEDQARQFMREAAEKAGIPREQLVLALEPEAASVYCLAFCKANQNLMKPFSVGKGAKFMMVDCGGGTIDISILEITATGNLRHLHKSAGTADGGVSVDDAFKAFLFDLVCFDGVTSLEPLEMLHLRRSLEKTKRSFKASDEKAHIQIPPTVKELLSVEIASSEKYSNRVSIARNVLSLDGDLFLSFYNQATAGITAAIRDALDTNTVDAIFLAGGFSESDVIQNAVQQAFQEVQVVTAQTVSQSVEERQPFSPVGAVLMGAVMYGHDPQVIATRVSAYTYGVDAEAIFREGVHDKRRAVVRDDGIERCRDCFAVHVSIDQEVEVNSLLPYEIYFPVFASQTEMPFNIYRTKKEKPLYVDEEGVEKIGTMTVLVPDTTGGTKRKIEAAMMVGGTELKLIARNPVTHKEFTTTCEFLSRN